MALLQVDVGPSDYSFWWISAKRRRGPDWIRNGVYGVYTLNGIFVPYSVVESAAEGFAAGWWACSPSNIYLNLGIGVNNYGPYVDSRTGADWANVAKAVATWVSNRGYSDQVTVWGAADLEPSWNSTTNTCAWADGYAGVSGRPPYYDFGSADGCPTSGTRPGIDGTCNNGWRQSDVWYVSWGVSPAWPLPQIYNTTGANARQWQQISLYGYYNQSGRTLYFPGEMTQYQACQQRGGCAGTDNTPSQGWQQLYDALNCYGSTPCPTSQSSLPYSTDIKWNK